MTSTRFFTLLEVMIAIILLAMASSVIGIRVKRALDEKEFQTGVDRLFAELESCHCLALNMQADWTAILEKNKDQWILQPCCFEAGKSFSYQWKSPGLLRWNHAPAEKIAFLFSSTGKVAPIGILEIQYGKKKIEWKVPEVFSMAEGSDRALPRPDEKVEGQFKSG